MFDICIHAALALSPPQGKPAKRTPEQETREVIRSVMEASAVFALQGAFFHPTAEGSVDCFKRFLELQTDMFKLDLEGIMEGAK